MDAAAEKSSIGFEEYKMTILRDGANQMRNAGVIQRLASPDPNDRRAAANNIADLFVRNWMAGIGMQNFRRIHEPDGAGALPPAQCSGGAGHCEGRGKPPGGEQPAPVKP